MLWFRKSLKDLSPMLLKPALYCDLTLMAKGRVPKIVDKTCRSKK